MTRSLLSLLRASAFAAACALIPAAAVAEVAPGAYLAALSARQAEDFAQAASYFQAALKSDPDNPLLIEETLRALIGLGAFAEAKPFAERLEKMEPHSQLSAMVLLADLVTSDQWKKIAPGLASGSLSIAPPVDGLISAWTLAAMGKDEAALAELDKLIANRDTAIFGLYHRALMLAQRGDFAGAEAVFAGTGNASLPLTRRGLTARIEVLSNLGRHQDALKLLDEGFDDLKDPPVAELKRRLEAQEALPLSVAATPKEGLAEVFYTVALALGSDGPAAYALAFSRLAAEVQPDHYDAIMLSASLLESLNQTDLTIDALAKIPVDSVNGFSAQLGRAQALMSADRYDEAIAALTQITQTYPTMPAAFRTLADAYRDQDRWGEAVTAYSKAAELYGEPQPETWGLYYMRAIAHERLGDWAEAEADLRFALKLRPGQPQVLNNLGYSLLERKEKLDEALSLIEQAVKAQPKTGYIVDSLGWAYFRLGRYDEAVTTMERAAALMAVDPEVNDHLGDVYWAVGRKREAEFQWRRALSFKDDRAAVDFDRIRRKLEVGLDQVLAEEGAPPLENRAAN